MYKCLNCQKEITAEQIKDVVRCPFCGFRVMMKERGKNPVKIKAR